MQTQWYGDKRDLVKWGTLVHLCRENQVSTIIQVPFLPKENGCPHKLAVDRELVDLPPAVWQHFRDLTKIEALGQTLGLKIHVLKHAFSHEGREEYLNKVLQELADLDDEAKIVFLDPDTGIEPRKAGSTHVKAAEITRIWNKLNRNDWLVLYQHAQHTDDWRAVQMARFCDACDASKPKMFCCEDINDVVFYAAQKPEVINRERLKERTVK